MPVRKCPKHRKEYITCTSCNRPFRTRIDYIRFRQKRGISIKCRSCSSKRGYLKSLVNKLTEIDATYLAGMLDADGCISYSKQQPQVNITNTYLPLLEWVKQVVGGGSIHIEKPLKPQHKPKGRWILCRYASIKDFLTQLVPYMKIKLERARKMIAKCP